MTSLYTLRERTSQCTPISNTNQLLYSPCVKLECCVRSLVSNGCFPLLEEDSKTKAKGIRNFIILMVSVRR